MAALAEALPNLRALRKLKLSENPLDGRRGEGIKALAQALPQCPALQILSVLWCTIGDEGVTAIVEALPNLRELRLNGCKIGDAGGLAIAEALPRCEPLKELELRDDSLSEATQAALRDKALPTPTQPYLRRLIQRFSQRMGPLRTSCEQQPRALASLPPTGRQS